MESRPSEIEFDGQDIDSANNMAAVEPCEQNVTARIGQVSQI